MKALHIESVGLDELKENLAPWLKETVIEAYKEIHAAPTPEKRGIYATRKEACKELKISLPTLDKLMDEGTLIRYHISGRILLRWSEIEAAVNQGLTIKYRKA